MLEVKSEENAVYSTCFPFPCFLTDPIRIQQDLLPLTLYPCYPVLIRIVRMTFRPEALETFLGIFDVASPQIRAFPGCSHLELWQDHHYPNILTTYSHWADSESLNHYRHSDLFKQTWSITKPLFAAPPVAFSNHILRNYPNSE